MSFKKHIFTVSSTQFILFVLGFVMSILNARLLGPAGVGVIVLLQFLQNISVRISDLGFGRAFRYYSANSQISFVDLKNLMFNIGWKISIVVVIFSILLKTLPLGVWDGIDLKIYFVFLPTLFFYVLIMYIRHLLHGQLQISTVNYSEVLERLMYLFLFIYFVWVKKMGVLGAVISLSLSTVLVFVILLIRFKAYTARIAADQSFSEITPAKHDNIKKLWNYGKWSYFAGIIDYLNNTFAMIFLKSQIPSFTKIGYFSKAQGISNYPKILAIPLSGLLFSYNSGSESEDASSRTNTSCRITLWLVTIFFAIIGIFIESIIIFLYGKEFLPAAEIFFYLYPSVIFYIQSLFLSSAIAATGLNKEVFKITIISFPFIVIITVILVVYFDITGAAVALSVTFFLLWIMYLKKYVEVTKSRFKDILIINKTDFLAIAKLLKTWLKIR